MNLPVFAFIKGKGAQKFRTMYISMMHAHMMHVCMIHVRTMDVAIRVFQKNFNPGAVVALML